MQFYDEPNQHLGEMVYVMEVTVKKSLKRVQFAYI